MYSIINNISPSYLNKFVHNRPICQYGLRSNSSHTLHVPFPHTESFKNHCSIVVPSYGTNYL